MVEGREQRENGDKIEITGFKEKAVDENVFMKKLLEKVGCVGESGVEYKTKKITRTAGNDERGGSQTLVVQFKTVADRDLVLDKIKKGKLYAKMGDVVGDNTATIYFNEYLTPYYKKLYYEARKLKKEKKYAFLWIKSGKILLKKNENSRIETLASMMDLVIHWNIRSIRNHWDLICAKLEPVLPHLDVLILSEINIKEEETSCYHLENFKQLSICRASRKGGGVMMFYRDTFQVDNLSYNFDEAENLAIKLTHSAHKIEWLILAIYRSPKSILNKFLDDIDFWLRNASKKTDNIIMIGDINVCIKNKNSTNLRYLNMLYSNTLVPLINDITREEVIDGRLTLSSIDHINVRMKRDFNYTATIITDKVADHYLVALCISKAGMQRSNAQNGPLYKQIIDNRKIQHEIDSTDWIAIKNKCADNPEKLYEEIVHKFSDIYESSKKTIKIRDTKLFTPWVNERVKKEIDLKQKLLQIWRNNKKNLFNYERYKIQRNAVTNLIKKQKRIYTYKKFQEAKGDMQKTWSLINDMMNRKKRDPVDVTIQKNFQSNDLETLSNQFNKNFSEQINKIKIKNQGPNMNVSMEEFVPQNTISSIYLRKASTKDIRIILKNMKKTGKGIDGIRNVDMINNWITFVPIITHLVNSFIEKSTLPDGLKISCITPLYKHKGKINEMSSYRPVGSMPVIEKVFEKHINIQIKKYLHENKIIPEFQHGFQSGKSTITLLQEFSNLVNTALDQRKCAVIVLLDLSLAFDTLEHSILLEKFNQVGITHPILQNFFLNRKQLTRLGEVKSELEDVRQGLVQGGVNSPTWFNVYTYDIQYVKRTGVLKMFADDSCIVSIHTDVQTAVANAQKDFIELQKYFFKNSIFLNEKKTEAMVLGFASRRMDMSEHRIICHTRECLENRSYENSSCSCHRVDYSTNVRYLGVFIDDQFKMKQHVFNLSKKLRIVNYKLVRINAERMPLSTKKTVYFSLVDSLLRYGVTMYTFAPQYVLDQVNRIQRKIKKLLFKDREDIVIFTPNQLSKLILLCLNFQNDKYRIVTEHRYTLRQQNFYRPKVYTISYGERRLEYAIPTLLNKYCNQFLDENDKKLLTKKIKDSLLNTE
ncbi:hypothetical protein WDU94_012393 [Cyamophila willieti]